MLKYELDFAIPVEAAGLVPRDCGEYHWQIKGGRHYKVVNCWDTKRRGFRFEAWQALPTRDGTVADAIRQAGPPEKPAAGLAEIAPFDMVGDPEERQVGFIRWLCRKRFVLWLWRKIW